MTGFNKVMATAPQYNTVKSDTQNANGIRICRARSPSRPATPSTAGTALRPASLECGTTWRCRSSSCPKQAGFPKRRQVAA